MLTGGINLQIKKNWFLVVKFYIKTFVGFSWVIVFRNDRLGEIIESNILAILEEKLYMHEQDF